MLALNADTLWQVSNPQDCDPLNELCQSYVMIEVLAGSVTATAGNNTMWEVVPGFDAKKCVVRGTDVRNAVLVWRDDDGATRTSADLPPDIKMIRLRITMRDAILYAITVAGLPRDGPS